MPNKCADEFSGASRVHIGLGVKSLARSVEFYRVLFNHDPTKMKDGYAKFEVAAPSINLSLIELEEIPHRRQPGALHYGIQVASTEEVRLAARRLSMGRLETAVEKNVACCHAVQEKVWVNDPDGNAWEVFTVLESDVGENSKNRKTNCCLGIEASQASVS